MSGNLNKLSQFWQELKRRKVTRTITVYAAAAFVILELTDIVAPSLGLPNWTLNFIIILLCIGFIIAVILSWIYDIHPEGGVVKTEPSDKVKEEDIPKSSNSWKIASYISFIIILALIVLNILPRSGKSVIIDKSVAVLPFINDSQDLENEYLFNGITEDLLINLQSIKDLRVLGRSSTEQYRNFPMSIPEIAAEMKVAYILEGSGQRYGNKIRLRVQLVEGATDANIWANSYDEIIIGPEDIFRIQSEISQAIAAALQAVITPEVKRRIEKIPTSNLTAYDFYQRGREELWRYSTRLYKVNSAFLKKAENLYHLALDYDSSYAQAYAGLADVLLEKYTHFESLNLAILDSAVLMADKALSIDQQVASAHTVKGKYYLITGNKKQALKEFTIAIELNPNDYQIYFNRGTLYWGYDIVELLDNYHKAASLASGKVLAEILNILSSAYIYIGFEKEGVFYASEALKLGGDSATFFANLASIEIIKGNDTLALGYYKRMHSLNPDDLGNLMLIANYHSFIGQYEESIECYEKLFGQIGITSAHDMRNIHRLGLAYWHTGEREKAQEYFNRRIAYAKRKIERENYGIPIEYYDLAATYAFLGEKDEALANLKLYQEKKSIEWLILLNWLKEQDPLFDGIRHDPEFQQIVSDIEAKYEAEHERVRLWLEDNDML